LFCSFSHILSSCTLLPLPFSPNMSPHYPLLLHTHEPRTNLLYQLYTTPNPCNTWHKHPLLQQKYTQTHIKNIITSSPHTASITHLPHFPPSLVPP
jgi:hypothetical protein